MHGNGIQAMLKLAMMLKLPVCFEAVSRHISNSRLSRQIFLHTILMTPKHIKRSKDLPNLQTKMLKCRLVKCDLDLFECRLTFQRAFYLKAPFGWKFGLSCSGHQYPPTSLRHSRCICGRCRAAPPSPCYHHSIYCRQRTGLVGERLCVFLISNCIVSQAKAKQLVFKKGLRLALE